MISNLTGSKEPIHQVAVACVQSSTKQKLLTVHSATFDVGCLFPHDLQAKTGQHASISPYILDLLLLGEG